MAAIHQEDCAVMDKPRRGRRVQYEAAVAGKPCGGKPIKTPGSLRWYWDVYRQSTSWTCLSLATRRQRESIFVHVLEKSGDKNVGHIKRSDIIAGRERRAHTPAQARYFLDAMRGFFGWLVDAGHLKADPTAGVKNSKRPKNQGFPVWTEDDVAKYEARWPIGTKERVRLNVLLHTGLRRGAAVRLGTVTVTLPILDVHATTTLDRAAILLHLRRQSQALHQRILRQPLPRSV
jgi:site-specific recombinase XerC